jgi:hypothetical protein
VASIAVSLRQIDAICASAMPIGRPALAAADDVGVVGGAARVERLDLTPAVVSEQLALLAMLSGL